MYEYGYDSTLMKLVLQKHRRHLLAERNTLDISENFKQIIGHPKG